MVKFELDKKRIGFRIVFNSRKLFLKDGFEVALFPPRGVPWYALFYTYEEH